MQQMRIDLVLGNGSYMVYQDPGATMVEQQPHVNDGHMKVTRKVRRIFGEPLSPSPIRRTATPTLQQRHPYTGARLLHPTVPCDRRSARRLYLRHCPNPTT